MARSIIMPRFGMTQEEATIVRWIRQEGDRVENGDPICEVTTDKVNMEVEAPADGILAGLQYAEGETVPVTVVIGYILAEGELLPDSAKQTEPTGIAVEASVPDVKAEPGGEAQSAASNQVASGGLPPNQLAKATPLARRMASAEQVDLTAVQGSGRAGAVTRQDIERHLAGRDISTPTQPGKVPASPAARRLAYEGGIDLNQVTGSGPGGRVQGWDIRAAQAAHSVPPSPPAMEFQTDEAHGTTPEVDMALHPVAIPLEGMRRTIAQRMQASWQNIPHIQFNLDVDMSRAIAMREQFNLRFGGGMPGSKSAVSITAVLVKACAAALRQHPELNSYLRDDQIWRLPEVNIGVAVALEAGLIVPVVRSADEKGLVAIGQEVADLSSRARQGNLKPQEVMDGTFTISNLGMLGVDSFTAIINPPQVAILAVGRLAERFVPDEARRPILRPMMTLALSADHRAVDGAEAARFLSTLCGILETAGVQWG